MAMTSSEREKCHWIIHSHAATAAAGNALPVPGLGVAVDTITMTTMAMALAAVFGSSIEESVAKNMAINAIKKTMLKNPIKTVTKELSKLVPGLGQIVSPSISVTMLESAGWVLAEQLSNKRGKFNEFENNEKLFVGNDGSTWIETSEKRTVTWDELPPRVREKLKKMKG